MSATTDWAGSGLAWLTGSASGPPDFSRAAVLTRAREITAELQARTGVEADAGTLLAGRAALSGLSRQGKVSAGGASRLLRTADGWCAVTLSRPDDVGAVPALVQREEVPDPWAALTAWTARRPSSAVVERTRLLDIPASALGETSPAGPHIRRAGERGRAPALRDALIVDMTSMWAGPLCGQLLAQAGATVIKVESPARPDGTRTGERDFFDWLNHGKLSCAVDFDRERRFLHTLLSVADVVLEGSRPAALPRRGLGPDDLQTLAGRVWVRITAHGSGPADADRTGFGDDAAVAGGLVGRGVDGPVFCADAVADPLTGLEAARAVLGAMSRGGGEVITVSLAAVAAGYAALPQFPSASGTCAAPPQRPHVSAAGPALGADNERVSRLVARTPAPCSMARASAAC